MTEFDLKCEFNLVSKLSLDALTMIIYMFVVIAMTRRNMSYALHAIDYWKCNVICKWIEEKKNVQAPVHGWWFRSFYFSESETQFVVIIMSCIPSKNRCPYSKNEDPMCEMVESHF